jgi:ATP-dependent Clp protease ATP-binding subunit ClpC
MYEHFDEHALRCVEVAQDEARRLGHEEVGTVHLLLGLTHVAQELVGLPVETVRAAVVALNGSGPAPTIGMIPFSSEAITTATGANSQALSLGHTIIDPAHLLLALLEAGGGGTRALREAGAIPSEVRERAQRAAGGAEPDAPDDDPPDVAAAHEREFRLLELMLLNDTPAGRLLRSHGIDEARLRERLRPPGQHG